MKLFISSRHRVDSLTATGAEVYACLTTKLGGHPHPSALAAFLRPKFIYGRDDRPKYKTLGKYASRLNSVVESRPPTTNGKAFKLKVKEFSR